MSPHRTDTPHDRHDDRWIGNWASVDPIQLTASLRMLLLSCVLLAGGVGKGMMSAAAQSTDDAQRMEESAALTEWLARAGLDELLTVVLDEHVRKSTTTNPASISRLTGAYLRLINGASDEDRIADLRVRINRFLQGKQIPDRYALLLALARAEYRMSLRGIERFREGSNDKADRVRGESSLLHARESLDRLAELLSSDIAENQLLIGGIEEQQRIGLIAASTEASTTLLSTKFLRAWCLYWSLWMDRPSAAHGSSASGSWKVRADSLVGTWSEVLETGKAVPEPQDCSVDLIGEEYYAQSILGMALTRALQSEMTIADGWFDLLDQPGVWDGLADDSAWYLHALVDTQEYARARKLIEVPSVALDGATVVGAAIRALNESKNETAAIEFARAAMRWAAIRGDFAAVRRLARCAPALREGTDFSAALSRGIDAYDRGRSESDSGIKTSLMHAAARELAGALELVPEDRHTRAAVVELLAWSQLGAGTRCDAAESFLLAANQSTGQRAEAVMWMAVDCAARGDCADSQGVPGGLGFEFASAYLLQFDAGLHAVDAASILARRVDAHTDDALVDRLVRDAMRSDGTSKARVKAGELLYRRFRAASGSGRRDHALRLLAIPPVEAKWWPANSIDIVMRQQLEAALDPEVSRVDDAQTILEGIWKEFPVGQEPLEIRSELAVRRLAVALACGDPAIAHEAIRTLRGIADAQWAPFGENLYVKSMDAFLSKPGGSSSQVVQARLGLVTARRALREIARKSGDPAQADAANRALARELLAAAHALAQQSAFGVDAPRGTPATTLSREAISIARELLAQRPDDIEGFTILADAAIGAGDRASAFEALSRLVSALPVQSVEWFGRKADLCELMAITQPEEVRKILAQHAVLIPEWGPGTEGARLKTLATRLGVTPSAPPRSGGSSK
ncbi:MAG: hypothetical protein EXS15_03925 [Phycisphaerales bacterium]|nr:hypothetical protein [Phycisphaerales bacterium]